MKRCRCGAEIVFITTPKGKQMPCEPDPFLIDVVDGGTVVGVTNDGRVVKGEIPGMGHAVTNGAEVRAPHWASCQLASRYRRR